LDKHKNLIEIILWVDDSLKRTILKEGESRGKRIEEG
jgi:hypothetical protein